MNTDKAKAKLAKCERDIEGIVTVLTEVLDTVEIIQRRLDTLEEDSHDQQLEM